MRWAFAVLVVCVVASFATAIYIVLGNRDPVPNEISACVKRAGLAQARSQDALSAVRADIAAGPLKITRRWDWGKTRGVLFEGPGKSYAMLALWNSDSASLAASDAGQKVFNAPGTLPLVSVEVPDNGVLLSCAQRADR
ncbi:unannotated protein [freshwater metagenome]|uniref:Unannotated protein n=1 Tax=freshwater metagenome TaxID=449393 RepID=A0A6J5Z7E8_9ZZZZ|nr:hypothetical protein [Actinomycetota bacterium]